MYRTEGNISVMYEYASRFGAVLETRKYSDLGDSKGGERKYTRDCHNISRNVGSKNSNSRNLNMSSAFEQGICWNFSSLKQSG